MKPLSALMYSSAWAPSRGSYKDAFQLLVEALGHGVAALGRLREGCFSASCFSFSVQEYNV